MKTVSRVMSVLLIVALLGVSFGVVSQRAHAQGATAVVNTGALNLRSGPGAGYPRVTSVYRGTVLSLMARNLDASWLRVGLNDGRQGWVNAGYVWTTYPIWSLPAEGAPVPGQPVATVATGALNLRAGPGIGYARIVSLPRGASVTLLSRNGAWVKVQTQIGQIGWVNSGYLSTAYPIGSLPVEGAPTPPPTYPPQPPQQPTYRTHVVQYGENLFRISLQYGVSMYSIAAANGIWDLSRIYAGQVLVIPWS